MKYVVFFQQANFGAGTKAYEAMSVMREKSPDKYPKQLTPVYIMPGDFPDLKEKLHGFYLIEADKQEQLDDFVVAQHSSEEKVGLKENTGVVAIMPVVDATEAIPKWKALQK